MKEYTKEPDKQVYVYLTNHIIDEDGCENVATMSRNRVLELLETNTVKEPTVWTPPSGYQVATTTTLPTSESFSDTLTVNCLKEKPTTPPSNSEKEECCEKCSRYDVDTFPMEKVPCGKVCSCHQEEVKEECCPCSRLVWGEPIRCKCPCHQPKEDTKKEQHTAAMESCEQCKVPFCPQCFKQCPNCELQEDTKKDCERHFVDSFGKCEVCGEPPKEPVKKLCYCGHPKERHEYEIDIPGDCKHCPCKEFALDENK